MDDERRRQRREARRRELARRRRRRLLAGVSLLLALALVVAVALLASSGGSAPSATSAARSAAAYRRSGGSAAKGTGPGSSAPASGSGAYSGTPTGKPGTESAPILMYHVINPAPAGAAFPGLYVSASEFAAQMQALAHAGFHAVTLDQLRAYWQDGAPLPAGKPIVVSFDNGYQSQYTNALPVLRRAGLGRRREHPAGRPAALAGRALAGPGPRSDRGRLGARHAGLQPRRTDRARRERARVPDRRGAQADPAALRRPCELVLLPVRALRRERRGGGQGRGLRRLDHSDPGLGRPAERTVPPAAPARARRHQPRSAARRDRRHS